MIILLTIFASSFVIALSGAMMPGPLLTATISESTRGGFRAGPMLILGHGLLELFLVAALILGLAPVFQNKWVFISVALAGSIFLLWMAVDMFRSLSHIRLPGAAGPSEGKGLVIKGILLSVSNPYWIVWWATIGIGYIVQSRQYGLWGVAFFYAGHIMADLAWYGAVSSGVGRGRHFLSDRVYRGIIGVCAVFLLAFAFYFLYAGIVRMF
jgi:threonine/homoserine/homoserine lactone efflux protein